MKNQNDLIVLISAMVVMLGGVMAIVFTAPKPLPPQAPEAVVTTPAQPPATSVVYANALPGGSGNSGAGGSGGMGAGATPAGNRGGGGAGATPAGNRGGSPVGGGARPSRGR